MDVLPRELRGCIYSHLADHNLLNMCVARDINYDKFCQFLRTHRAAVYGSSALSCFGYRQANKILNIIVLSDNIQEHYSDLIATLLNNHSYSVYSYVYDRQKFIGRYHLSVKSETLSIGVLIGNIKIFPSMREFLQDVSDIDFTAIAFDGYEWFNPFLSMADVMENRIGKLINPFVNRCYISENVVYTSILPQAVQAAKLILFADNKYFLDKVVPQHFRDTFTNFIEINQKYSTMIGQLSRELSLDVYIPNSKNFHDQVLFRLRDKCEIEYDKYLGVSGDHGDALTRRQQIDRLIFYLSQGFSFTNISQLLKLYQHCPVVHQK